MKLRLPLAVLSPLLLFCAYAAAGERIPVESFAKSPSTSRARLSPDGKHLAYIADYIGRPTLHVMDIDARRARQLMLGEAAFVNNMSKEVGGYCWVNDQRLLVTSTVWDMYYGVVATNINGTQTVPISGYELENVPLSERRLFIREVIHTFYDADGSVLMLDRHEGGPGLPNRPDVVRVDTMHAMVTPVIKNPGEVGGWATDADGVVRLGLLSHGDQSGVIYRENGKAEWRTVLPLKDRRNSMRQLGFDSANNRIFVAALTPEKRWTIFPIDPATGQMGSALLSDSEYDILPQRYTPLVDGHPLAAPIFSYKDSLLGVRYVGDTARVKWFDPDMGRMQATMDRLAKETVNILVDQSRDGKRQLWFGFSDKEPGIYYLVDLEKKSIKPIAQCMPWIDPAQMGQTLSVKYKARDGLLIHGFLTVPLGHDAKNLPMVVMPHGGPWVRDVWGFDPVVQLLASRGFAVLQMNYRGSPGYGEELFKQATRQIGKQIQDDIEDGTRWAIEAGVADPKRIAIFGGSYGGYSALFALGHNPELYRCGISLAGVTDWYAMYHSSDVAEYKNASRHWREEIGDPDTDRDFLKAISPVNFADKITAPVLIIQGKEDRRVPPDQARRMISALEKVGRKPESLFLSDVAHNLGHERHRIQIYNAIVKFLEKNLGPGVD